LQVESLNIFGQAEQLYRLLPFPLPEKEDGCEHQSQEKTAEAAEERQFTFKMRLDR